MKKLLIVSQYFWPEEFRINELATSLGEEELEIEVLTQVPSYPNPEIFKGKRFNLKEKFAKITIYRIPTLARRSSRIGIFVNYLSYILLSLPYLLFFRFKRFDYLLVFQPSPVTVGFWPAIVFNKSGVKKLIWILDLWPDTFFSVINSESKLLNLFVEFLSKFIYKRFDYLLVQTKGFQERLMEMDILSTKIKLFPNFSEEIFQKPLIKNSPIDNKVNEVLEIIPDGFNILFAGNLGFSQDIKSVLKAAKLCSSDNKINWIFIGTGRAEESIRQEIRDNNLNNIFLLGRYDLEYMPYFFDKSDVMLVSLSNEAAFSITIPGKIPSYMACAKPILGMLSGEGKVLIEESGSGLCALAGDFNSLSKNTLMMAGLEPYELADYSKQSQEYYKNNLSKTKALEIIKSILEDG